MTENNKLKKRTILYKAVIILTVLVIIFGIGALVYNNVSFTSDAVFATEVDAAIEKGLKWSEAHKSEIIKRGNIGLIKMIKEIQMLKPTPLFSDIVNEFMAKPTQPRCWKRLLDPNWPISKLELNTTLDKESLDNKWILYAIAPDIAKVTPEEMQLFEPDRWHGRKLAHQLDALTALRESKGVTEQLDRLIEHLCNRISNELFLDVLKVKPGQITFVLRAGWPQKIRRRWIERIIAGQLSDGGWNNKWYYFVLEKRSIFNLSIPSANQHDTLLALTVLYLVKYQYPEHFGLK